MGIRMLVTTTDLTPIYTSLLAEWADHASETAGSAATPPAPDDDAGGSPAG